MEDDNDQSDGLGGYIDWREDPRSGGPFHASPRRRNGAPRPHARRKAAVLIGMIALVAAGLGIGLASESGVAAKVAIGSLVFLTAIAAWKMYRT